ncbi:MAG TPA: hypothetical protein VK467_11045 [Gemmatimonadales bacterium]|nr:hypothetical protein [Gemmatimonadales bacterium]
MTLLLLLLLQSPHARLEGRVPTAALPGLDSLIEQAVAESLPTEPLVQKALEGGAKGIPVPRLVNGVRHGLVQLRDARAIVSRATPARASLDGDVAAVAAALARGLDPRLIERLLPGEPPGPVLHAAADLVAHGFPADSAAELLRAAQQQGLHGTRLLDVAVAASHELQREGGRTPVEALARVRAMLPNVPVATPPHPRTVTRRPGRGS